MTVGKRALGFAAVLVVGLGALLLVGTRWAASADSQECRPAPGSADVRKLGTIAARLRVAQPDNSLIFQFGGQRGTRSRDLSLDLIDETVLLDPPIRPTNGEQLAVRTPRLVDRETNSQIPTDKVHVQAIYDEQGRAVTFEVCVDVRTSEGFGAGQYQGVATLTDARFVEAEVPVDVSLRSNSWLMPMAAAVIGGVSGGVWGTISPLAAGYKQGAKSNRELRRQAYWLLGISATLGIFAGAFVWWQRYVEIPHFRGLGSDARAVATTAFVTALTVYPIAAAIEIFLRILRSKDAEHPAAVTAPATAEVAGEGT